ncbi:hypothetical protein LXJ15735_09600 [Lacrimispora xylanolytica]
MLNICFSTTYGWNPGDELILAGVKNILTSIMDKKEMNFIIYNRNPDIRSQFKQIFKSSKVPGDFNLYEETGILESHLKFGMFDNSVKAEFDGSCLDWVIFAGTPEWSNGRCYDLYRIILNYNIPVMILGVGGGMDCFDDRFKEVIGKSKILTVREETTKRALEKEGFNPLYLSCPALLSAPDSKEKKIDVIRKIGLIYQATVEETIIWNGCSQELYHYEMNLYRDIFVTYGERYEICLVCHYIDELPLAKRDFPEADVLYSYKAEDYVDIYRDFDMVIGPRVHGIGCAASLLIPGIAILHDARGETCQGFLAELINPSTTFDDCKKMIDNIINNPKKFNDNLYAHKRKTFEEYKAIVKKGFMDPQVNYFGKIQDQTPEFDLKEINFRLNLVEKLLDLDNTLADKFHSKCERHVYSEEMPEELLITLEDEKEIELDLRNLLKDKSGNVYVDIKRKK